MWPDITVDVRWVSTLYCAWIAGIDLTRAQLTDGIKTGVHCFSWLMTAGPNHNTVKYRSIAPAVIKPYMSNGCVILAQPETVFVNVDKVSTCCTPASLFRKPTTWALSEMNQFFFSRKPLFFRPTKYYFQGVLLKLVIKPYCCCYSVLRSRLVSISIKRLNRRWELTDGTTVRTFPCHDVISTQCTTLHYYNVSTHNTNRNQ